MQRRQNIKQSNNLFTSGGKQGQGILSGMKHGGNTGVKRQSVDQSSKLGPSLISLTPIEMKKSFTLTSMDVKHRSDSRWYVPHCHDRYSAGWNRTFVHGFMNRPMVCNIRFYAIALESTLAGYLQGGTGYLTLEFKKEQQSKSLYYGFDKNETGKTHCYYMTNKGFGSEFIDNPKTIGIAIYCPISMDIEVGEHSHRKSMEEGFFCRVLSDYTTLITLKLRPTSFSVPFDYAKYIASTNDELTSEAKSIPATPRILKTKEFYEESTGHININNYRPHAVCTVQTFRNAQTGPMLYLFVSYYSKLGWKVIVYDRFGYHREFIEDLLSLPSFDYHNYTIFQIVNPMKYNNDYAAKQGFGYKIFYKMEKNWGYAANNNGTIADTADQDSDKVKTYDHCRIEYSTLDTIMYLDTDELFFCPQAGQNIKLQRKYQQKMFTNFITQGIEEMRMIRLPYSGLAPLDFKNNNRTEIENNDFTKRTTDCMQIAYNHRNITSMLGCWSDASSYDDFAKSADMGGVCPFHYNHWSCDGMRGGGRDATYMPRCRCKVGFELQNGFAYRPIVDK